jgi:carbohydrate-binding DOMON domain-containing protein
VSVPRSDLGNPPRRWRYYVLAGGYDAFGPDEYRPVTEQGGRWVFGGGRDSNLDPNVLDLLAPRFAFASQSRQLRPSPDGGLCLVLPVGGR